jgi:methionyl-tRNA formyltransferase
MRITVFTSNQRRHVALLDALRWDGHDVLAVVEPKPSLLPATPALATYWRRVHQAERMIFPDPMPWIQVPTCVLQPGEVSLAELPPSALEADRFVIFSASYIRGAFYDRLVAGGALNLHVGIAPEYRGSAPNFWAVYDGHSELVGAQVQRLATRLDGGEILAEVRPPLGGDDPFLRGMEACQLGIEAMVRLIAHAPDSLVSVRVNDRDQQIRYARHQEFTETVAAEYLGRLDVHPTA